MPPRHGKSELCSKFFPAWFLARRPDEPVILTSYEAQFAASWGRKVRDLVNEHGHELLGGLQVRPDVSATSSWETTLGGGMATAGIGGPITGKGASLLVVDDAIKNAEQAVSVTYRESCWNWFASTALTRLSPGGRVLVVMTRWHPDDLVGRLSKNLDEIGKPYRVLSLPAIAEEGDALGRDVGAALWPERYDVQALEATRKSVGEHWWNALYRQAPKGIEGSEWPESYFEGVWFDQWPDRSEVECRLMALDPSKGKSDRSGDYSAILLGYATAERLYCSAILRRVPAVDLARLSVQVAKEHKVDVMILESNQFQELLAGPIEEECRRVGHSMRVVGTVNTGNKVVRIRTLSGPLARREIRFRRGVSGTERLVQQLQDFPRGTHDDGPDALEMLYRLWRREMERSVDRPDLPTRLVVPGATT